MALFKTGGIQDPRRCRLWHLFITSHVLETVERLCEEVAIVTKPGKLVWQGDITRLARDGAIEHDGQEFHALEPLFLHLTGERYTDLNWL